MSESTIIGTSSGTESKQGPPTSIEWRLYFCQETFLFSHLSDTASELRTTNIDNIDEDIKTQAPTFYS